MIPKIFFICLAAALISCKAEVNYLPATVKILVGNAELVSGGRTSALTKDSLVNTGDVVRTGEKSIAVLSFGSLADAEIQPGSVFKVRSFNEKQKELVMERGGIWLRVNKKLGKDEFFMLNTPAAYAAVRGTKFYSFYLGDMQGFCFCQGDVDFKLSGWKEPKKQSQDYLVFNRGGKTITFIPSELKGLCEGAAEHKHSLIENSPLGDIDRKMTPQKMAMLQALAEKRFRETYPGR